MARAPPRAARALWVPDGAGRLVRGAGLVGRSGRGRERAAADGSGMAASGAASAAGGRLPGGMASAGGAQGAVWARRCGAGASMGDGLDAAEARQQGERPAGRKVAMGRDGAMPRAMASAGMASGAVKWVAKKARAGP